MKPWVYDIEIFKNVVLFGFISLDGKEQKIYEFSSRYNHHIPLHRFLTHKVSLLIGFNNLSYDNQIINYFLRTGIHVPKRYYEVSQKVINSYGSGTTELIPQIDLFKIGHFDRFKVSLKYCELGMRSEVVADLPYPFDSELDDKQIIKLRKYLGNDLSETLKLYNHFKDKIYLRHQIQKKYGLDCMNWSDSKLGEELLLKLYCEKTGRNPDIVSKLKSRRSGINLGSLILPYVQFSDPVLCDLVEELHTTTVKKTKGEFKKIFNYAGIETHVGLGGIHASKSGIFKSTETHKILDIDVGGMYPSIIAANGLYPEHLGEEFFKVLEQELIKPRAEIHKPLSKNMSLSEKERKLHGAFSDGLKLAGNSVYGKSGSPFSFVYDPKMMLTTTINGQLSLLMLVEAINNSGLEFDIIQENTDGITLYIRREDEGRVREIISDWEVITGLNMEYQDFRAMYIRDVNNFLINIDGTKTKEKGAYEVDKKVGSQIVFQKDHSYRIIPLAVREYIIKGIPVEQTIRNHDVIYDFCAGKRVQEDWYFAWKHHIKDKEHRINGKILRYYVATSGMLLFKCHKEDGRVQYMEAYPKKLDKNGQWRIKIFNKFREVEDYKIDYSYYVLQAQKLIDAIEQKDT